MPRVLRPGEQPRGLGEIGAVLVAEGGCFDRTGHHLPPVRRLAGMREVRPDREPGFLAHPFGQARGDFGEGHLVDDRGIEPLELGLVEPRGGASEMGEVERLDQHAAIGDRLDRLRRPQPREQRDHRLRLDPLLVKGIGAQRAQPLRQFALAPDQQRLMREARRRAPERGEHLDLQRGVGNMVLAAQHIGDAHRDIVDRARQHVEPRAVGAADHRVGQLRRLEMLVPAHSVLPFDRRIMVELEAPVGRDAFRGEIRMLGLGQLQCRAVVDRRQAAPEQHLALEFQLLRSLVGAVDASLRNQPLEILLVELEARRLPLLAVPCEPQPAQIRPDRLDVVLAAPLGVGVVDPQQETPARLLRQQPVMQRRANIADMQPPGGRGAKRVIAVIGRALSQNDAAAKPNERAARPLACNPSPRQPLSPQQQPKEPCDER